MSPSSEPKLAKRRAGRKRLPPLPQGDQLQFVIASHPDEFKAGTTMRNVRSHVMYKHRGVSPRERRRSGERSSTPGIATRTPSPSTTSSESVFDSNNFLALPSPIWDAGLHQSMPHTPLIGPPRHHSGRAVAQMVAQIIAVITADPAQSSPPATLQASEFPFPPGNDSLGQKSLHDLIEQYISTPSLFCCHDRGWKEMVCSNNMALLSHTSVVCVYKDVAEGHLEDTPLTVYAKTKAIRMITDSLKTPTDDFTLVSILHLLVSEIGGEDEDVFDVHQDALVRIVHQRGGLANLGMQGSIATYLTVVILIFTILRGRSEPGMLHGFVPSRSTSSLLRVPPPLSPLYAPQGNVSPLYASCSDGTFQIIADMQDLTSTFIARWNCISETYPSSPDSQLASFDAHMQQIYTRLLMRPSVDDEVAPDWVYETCRLAAMIYCRSIVQGVPFSESANLPHARSSGADASVVSLISALHAALEQTDRSGYWGNMGGVLLWICFVGGAASWPANNTFYYDGRETQASTNWTRKCFALFAVRYALPHASEHADAVVESQRTMLQVQQLINFKKGMSPQ